MDSYNCNATRKRKLNQSKERTDQKSVGCFGRCCARKKTEAPTDEQGKPRPRPVKKIVVEKERANLRVQEVVGAGDKNPNRLKTHLSRSPLYNESTWCGKPPHSEHDPCLKCTVQGAPDTWENAPKNRPHSNEKIQSDQKSTLVAPLSTFPEKRINSFVNDIIGDGVDRMSEMLVTTTNDRHQQIPPETNDTSSLNLAVHEEVAAKENQSVVLTKPKPSGVAFNKKDFESTSQTSHRSAVQLALDAQPSPNMADDYNWSLGLNSIEDKAVMKETSSQNQQSYNWEDEDYSWTSAHALLGKNPAIDNISNNPLQQTVIREKNVHPANDDTIDPSYSIASLSSSNKKQRVQSRILLEGLDKDSRRRSDQPSNSVSTLAKGKTVSSTMNAKLAQDQAISEQNDRFSSTSVSDLFKHVTDAKQQKSRDLASISTAYSIPVSMRPSVLPEMETDQNHLRQSQLDSDKNGYSSTTNPKRLKSNYSSSPWTYHDLVQSWRYFLQRLADVMLPSTHAAADQSITSTSQSWSTSTCAETQNSGPWWGRRDVDDHVPTTFIFANEPFTAWYSLDTRSVENRPCCSRDYHCSCACRCCCQASSS